MASEHDEQAKLSTDTLVVIFCGILFKQQCTGSSTNMCSIASTLSDEEVLTLAQFYNSQ